MRKPTVLFISGIQKRRESLRSRPPFLWGGDRRHDRVGGVAALQHLEFTANLLSTNAWTAVYINGPVTAVTNSYLPAPAGADRTFSRIRPERP